MTINELEQRCAARLSREDLTLSTTGAEANAYVAHTITLDRRLGQARNAMHALAALPSVDLYKQWLDLLGTSRATLCDELLSFKSPIRDPKVLGLQQNVRLSIRCIDRGVSVFEGTGYSLTNTRLGELMRAAGYEPVGADPERNYAGTMPWHGSMSEVEQRMPADVEAHRAAAQASLEEALLDDDERERRDAEQKARRDAANNAPVRKVRGDGSQYDRYPDGRRVEVSG